MIDLDELEARVRRVCAPWLPEDTAPDTLAIIAELRETRDERDEERERDEALLALDNEKMARYGREMEAMEVADEALAALAALREAAQAVFARYVLTATTTEIVREMAELGAALAVPHAATTPAITEPERARPAWLAAYDKLAARDRAHRKLAVRRLQDAFDDDETAAIPAWGRVGNLKHGKAKKKS